MQYTEICFSTEKKMKISPEKKRYLFNIFAQNVDCGYTLERWNKNKKNRYTPLLYKSGAQGGNCHDGDVLGKGVYECPPFHEHRTLPLSLLFIDESGCFEIWAKDGVLNIVVYGRKCNVPSKYLSRFDSFILQNISTTENCNLTMLEIINFKIH